MGLECHRLARRPAREHTPHLAVMCTPVCVHQCRTWCLPIRWPNRRATNRIRGAATSGEVGTTTNSGVLRLSAPVEFSEDRCVGQLMAANANTRDHLPDIA
jgi:hypothetical protein